MDEIVSFAWEQASSREGIAIQLFLLSLILIIVVSRLTNSVFQEPIGPFLAVPRQALSVFQHSVSADRTALPASLDGLRVKMSFDLLNVGDRGQVAARKAFDQLTVFRILQRRLANAEPVQAISDAWLTTTGEELPVLGVSPETFDRLSAHAERHLAGSNTDGLVVRLRAKLPLNPIDILIAHPDGTVRVTAWLMILPIWFGLIQELALR